MILLSGNTEAGQQQLEAGYEQAKLNPTDRQNLAECSLYVAGARHQQGNLDGALLAYIEAKNNYSYINDMSMQAMSSYGIGSIYNSQGRCYEAREEFKDTLKLGEAANDWPLFGLKGIALAVAHNNLALAETCVVGYENPIFRTYQDYEKAHQHLEEALRTLRNPPSQGQSDGIFDVVMAMMLSASGQDFIQEARSALEPIILNNLGQLYSEERSYSKAQSYFNEVWVKFNNIKQSSELGKAVATGFEPTLLNNIGLLSYRQGDENQALNYFQQALNLANNFDQPLASIALMSQIGFLYAKWGNYQEAINYYKPAMDIMDGQQFISNNFLVKATANGIVDAVGLGGSLIQFQELYNYATEVYIKLERYEEALLTSEKGRAKVFLDFLSAKNFQLADPQAQSLLSQAQEAYIHLKDIERKLIQGQQAPSGQLDLNSQFSQARYTYDNLATAIRQRSDNLGNLLPDYQANLSLSQIQNSLDDQTTLLSYYYLGKTPNPIMMVILS
ncbi:MAG: tetratricopeptide repeat protein [Deinococcales bacterium]